MSTFHHDGIDFHYEIVGAGRPLVFCHGLTGDLEQPLGILAGLPGLRLVVWDSRGHGRTRPTGPPEHLSFATFAADLRALLGSLGLGPVALGGISMGAGVAVRLAHDHPELVERLILVRPAWFDRPSPENLRLMPVIADLLDRFDPDAAAAALRQEPEFIRHAAVHPAAGDALLATLRRSLDPDRRPRLRSIPASVPLPSAAAVGRVRAPALVLGADVDPAHPFAIASRWAEALPGGRLERVPSPLVDRSAYERAVAAAVAAMLSVPPLRPSA